MLTYGQSKHSHLKVMSLRGNLTNSQVTFTSHFKSERLVTIQNHDCAGYQLTVVRQNTALMAVFYIIYNPWKSVMENGCILY